MTLNLFNSEIYQMMDELRELMRPYDDYDVIYISGKFTYLKGSSEKIAQWSGKLWKEIDDS